MKKVTKIRQKLHSKQFSKSYCRVERENTALSPDNITDEASPFLIHSQGDMVYAVTKGEPFENYVLAYEIDLQNTLPIFNSILLYRLLKLQFGDPDVLGALVSFKPDKPVLYRGGGIDWGYILKVSDGVFAEIRSIHMNVRFKIRYWFSEPPENIEERKKIGSHMAGFIESLIESIKKNAHLFNEDQDIDKSNKTLSSISNIFSEKYKSAAEMLSLANSTDNLPDRKDIEYKESVIVSTGGSIYMSSAILFVISLESLLNTIYYLLLKSEFQANQYDRITVRGDLDLRLISAHLFCHGFKKQIITPKSELWLKLIKLRKFRNDIVHGNVTNDHHVFALVEDNNLFFYCGINDFRGYKPESKSKQNYPTTMAQINDKVVSEIKDTIDQIVEAILESADIEHEKWIRSWLYEAVIPCRIPKRLTKE